MIYWTMRLDVALPVHRDLIIASFNELPDEIKCCPNGDGDCSLKKHLRDPFDSGNGKIHVANEPGLPVYVELEEFEHASGVVVDRKKSNASVKCQKVITGLEFAMKAELAFLWLGDGVFDYHLKYIQSHGHTKVKSGGFIR